MWDEPYQRKAEQSQVTQARVSGSVKQGEALRNYRYEPGPGVCSATRGPRGTFPEEACDVMCSMCSIAAWAAGEGGSSMSADAPAWETTDGPRGTASPLHADVDVYGRRKQRRVAVPLRVPGRRASGAKSQGAGGGQVSACVVALRAARKVAQG
jgi:hypothetical protein